MLLNKQTEIPRVPQERETQVVHKPHPHDSARLHVRGLAPYIDDLREGPRACCTSPSAARTRRPESCSASTSSPCAPAPGVVAVLTAADIPGANDIAPSFKDEPLFATEEILYFGQPLFAVVAKTRDAARRAAKLAKIEIAEAKPVLTVDEALASGARVLPDYDFGRGDIEAALKAAPHRLEGKFAIGGQEHFYLEGQIFRRRARRGARDDHLRFDAGPNRGAAHRRSHPEKFRTPS